jgi:pimeloyl-ACP methyl ester carboxylesterase
MKRVLKWASLALVVAFVAVIVVFWTPDTDPAAMRAKYGGAPSQFLDIGGGLTVHVRDEGPRDAPVVVLLHGSNSDLHTWDAWTKSLASKYRVIRLDQIGHGLTGPSPKRDYTPAAFVDTVDRVATKLGVAKFVLAGSSMGGGVAWQYAIAHPDRVTGLVLVDASGAPDLSKQSLPIGFRIAKTPVLRDVMLYITPRSIIASSMHQAVSNQAIVSDAMIDRTWELLRYPGNRQATMDRFATPISAVNTQALATIKAPTLILWGDDDKLLPVSGAGWFATQIAGSKVVTYPGIGHLPMEEAADKSAADLMNWLATVKPAR